jgi:hypothetical protein
MADFWNTDWLTRSEMFAPLRPVASKLPAIGWPDLELLNGLADEAGRVVNAQGVRVRFVAQSPKAKVFEQGFEQRAFLRGEVQVRPFDWHDLFNALVWMTFPTAKAVINARHFESMSAAAPGNRTPQRDALTLFDEDGVVVVSCDPELLDLVRGFRWRQLFWDSRNRVRTDMRFFVFGHALYAKALKPFIGMTGKGVLLRTKDEFFALAPAAELAELDRLLAAHLWDRSRLLRGRELSPLPVLGVPGWWSDNEQAGFYDNTAYFRPGRRSRGGKDQTVSLSR